MTNAEKVLNAARAELGVKESPAGSNRVKYNTWYYGREVSGSAYPWCMVFVQWCFKQAGIPLPNLTASCGALLSWYKANDPACIVKEPKAGDIVIFDFPNTQYSTDHTGIFESASGSWITTIDGNTGAGNEANGGAVMRRARQKRYVAAYIRPRELWEEEAQAVVTVQAPALAKGAKGQGVRVLQAALNALGHSCGTVDGSFGKATDAALRRYQAAAGLTADGSCGALTWGRILGG